MAIFRLNFIMYLVSTAIYISLSCFCQKNEHDDDDDVKKILNFDVRLERCKLRLTK